MGKFGLKCELFFVMYKNIIELLSYRIVVNLIYMYMYIVIFIVEICKFIFFFVCIFVIYLSLF